MARLKRIVKSALEDRSPRFLLATIALGVAISLIAGIAIGYRVEQSRSKPARRVATPTTKPGKTGRAGTTAITAAPDLTGAVFSPVKKNSLVIVYGKQEVGALRARREDPHRGREAREGIEHRGGSPGAVPAELGEPDHRDRGRGAPRPRR